jgi:hemolysin activation/secretion protein
MLDYSIKSIRLLLAATLLLAVPGMYAPPAFAQQETRFSVRTFHIEGNQLIDTARIATAVQVFTGPEQNFDTLRRAVEAVEALYADAGFGAVRVQLPEQDIADGIVRLKVIEARLGRIRVEGSRHFSDENIRASVPALVEGGPPNIDRAGASLALANDSFAKRTRVTLQRGETSGSVDAVLRVADIRPWRIATSLDNTGNSVTGDYRFGVSYQHANLFDRDHAFSAQYVTSPDHLDKVSILGLGYKIPIYARGDSIEAVYGRSNVDSGNVRNAYEITSRF